MKKYVLGMLLLILSGILGWMYGIHLADKIEREDCYHESMMEKTNCK